MYQTIQDYLDERDAQLMATARLFGNSSWVNDPVAGFRQLTHAELVAEEMIKIKAKRIEKESREKAEKAYTEAARRGVGTAEVAGPIVTRKALITRNKARWRTVEHDLREASRNGLRNAARAAKHGYWIEAAALSWADHRGHLSAPTMAGCKTSVFRKAF